jgi:lipopolysaccharide transport system ATP-binding protein
MVSTEADMTRSAISASNLSKKYTVWDPSPKSLFSKGGRRVVHALSEVMFQVPHGQVVGLVGSNGAGKSTLLRLVSGLSPPSSGSLEVDGKVTAILEITTGLIPERTGRENIEYMGRLYGMSREELRAKEQSIVEFAEIGRFIDYPARSYSAGMRSRLAFSIVTSVDPEILLIDEALSVGDAAFNLRCRQRIRDLCAKGGTVVVVSHDMEAIREMSDRVIWLHQGRIAGDGDVFEIVESYREVAHDQARAELLARHRRRFGHRSYSSSVRVHGIRCLAGSEETPILRLADSLAIEVDLECSEPLDSTSAMIDLIRFDGVRVATTSAEIDLAVGRGVLRADFGQVKLGRFTYQLRLVLTSADGDRLADAQTVFAVEESRHSYNSSVYVDPEWRLSSAQTGDAVTTASA